MYAWKLKEGVDSGDEDSQLPMNIKFHILRDLVEEKNTQKAQFYKVFLSKV